MKRSTFLKSLLGLPFILFGSRVLPAKSRAIEISSTCNLGPAFSGPPRCGPSIVQDFYFDCNTPREPMLKLPEGYDGSHLYKGFGEYEGGY